MWGLNFNEWGNTICGFGPGFGHGPGFVGWVFPILFWVVMAYIIVGIVKSLFSWKRSGHNDTALELLRSQFATGEINEQEYAAKKVILSKR